MLLELQACKPEAKNTRSAFVFHFQMVRVEHSLLK